MKNSLIYYYNIYVIDLNKVSDDYYFIYNGIDFKLEKVKRSISELNELYILNNEMIMNDIPVFQIVLTLKSEISFYYDNSYYVLLKLNKFHNRKITFDDVINFSYIPKNSYKLIDKSNWAYFWSNKIDYIEHQFVQMKNKYSLIDSSIDYYIGIWENGISFYNNVVSKNDFELKMVCHKRINSSNDLMYFYDPLNLVIDYKERNVGEYLKFYIFENNYSDETIVNFFNAIPKQYDTITRLIARLLFPSFYFDLYEKVIEENEVENILDDVIKKNNNYEKLLKDLFLYYNKFNVPYINWIIKKINYK